MTRLAQLSRRTLLISAAAVAAVIALVASALVLVTSSHREPGLPGTGGSPLLVTSAADPFTQYYAEILRAEGLTAFDSVELGDLTASDLEQAAVVLLPRIDLSEEQVSMISTWAASGGNLIAFRPVDSLAGLFGLSPLGETLSNAYLRVDTSEPPGQGITAETIQFHGPADQYATLPGTRVLGTLYSDAVTATDSPAVTHRSAPKGGGRVVAFTYDLARSIILTRQGNPDWAGQDRDGLPPIRPNDLFVGGEGRADYVDLSKAAIPQADEQQRLLVNIITELTKDRSVLVRSWYLPKGAKAALVMVVDDHSPDDRAREALTHQVEQSPPGCSVDDWECIRSTSLMYASGSLTDSELAAYQRDGFDFGVHVNTDCKDWTQESLRAAYTNDLDAFRSKYPSLPDQVATRIHCVAWSDYASAARIGLEFGIRLDLDYYYWPAEWVQNRPGFFTGSGIPMRFADTDGSLIDVYQAPSHLVNESGMDYPGAIGLLLDRALGPLGYYGAFGTHYDYSDDFDRELVAAAAERGVPMVSAAQLTEWLDARNASSFSPGVWTGASLSFEAVVDQNARELLRGLIPYRTAQGALASLTQHDRPVTFTTEVIKGIEYAVFPATTGSYQATYAEDRTAPTVMGSTPEPDGTLASGAPTISVAFSEPLKPSTVNTGTVLLTDEAGNAVPSKIDYQPGAVVVTVTPQQPLQPTTTYLLVLTDRLFDTALNPLATPATLSFRSAAGNASLWAPTEPDGVLIADDDRQAVELGLRFESRTDGRITGISFYKGSDGLSRHTVTLWDEKGKVLARARTRSEDDSGWQTARFSKPVPIRAGKVYTASYLAPEGRYAHLPGRLKEDYTNGYLVALGDGDVYRYGGGHPTINDNASNYLVDVVFRAG